MIAPLLPGFTRTRAKGYKALGLRLGLRLGLQVRLGWGWGCGQGEMGRGQVTIAGGGGAVAQHAYFTVTILTVAILLYSHRVVRQRRRRCGVYCGGGGCSHALYHDHRRARSGCSLEANDFHHDLRTASLDSNAQMAAAWLGVYVVAAWMHVL